LFTCLRTQGKKGKEEGEGTNFQFAGNKPLKGGGRRERQVQRGEGSYSLTYTIKRKKVRIRSLKVDRKGIKGEDLSEKGGREGNVYTTKRKKRGGRESANSASS